MSEYTSPDGKVLVVRIPYPRQTATSGPPPPIRIESSKGRLSQGAASTSIAYIVYEPVEEGGGD